jgi:hypothetical protein
VTKNTILGPISITYPEITLPLLPAVIGLKAPSTFTPPAEHVLHRLRSVAGDQFDKVFRRNDLVILWRPGQGLC